MIEGGAIQSAAIEAIRRKRAEKKGIGDADKPMPDSPQAKPTSGHVVEGESQKRESAEGERGETAAVDEILELALYDAAERRFLEYYNKLGEPNLSPQEYIQAYEVAIREAQVMLGFATTLENEKRVLEITEDIANLSRARDAYLQTITTEEGIAQSSEEVVPDVPKPDTPPRPPDQREPNGGLASMWLQLEQAKDAIYISDLTDPKVVLELRKTFNSARQRLEAHFKRNKSQAAARNVEVEIRFKQEEFDEILGSLTKLSQRTKQPQDQRRVAIRKKAKNDASGRVQYKGEGVYHLNRSELTKQGKELGWTEKQMAKFDLGALAVRIREGADGPVRESAAYKFLERQALKGQSLEEMESVFSADSPLGRPDYVPEDLQKADLVKARELFVRDVKEGRNDPLARVATQMTLYFYEKHPEAQEDFQGLNAKTAKESEKKLKELMKELWKDFVYSAKLDPKTGRPSQKFYDSDVSISLWLLKKAGFKWDRKEHVKKTAVRQGERSPLVLGGKIGLDVGGESGAVMKEVKGPDENSYTIMVIDNHPIFRDYPTAAAKILFHTLDQMGLLELDKKERRAVRMMLKYSEDDDNCTYDVGRANRIAVFNLGDKTLFGLGYALTAQEMYEYFLHNAASGDEGKAYRNAVFTREFTEDELKKKYKLHHRRERTYWRREEILDPDLVIAKSRSVAQISNVIDRQTDTIEQAEEWLGKPLDQLTQPERQGMIEDGRVLETRFGTFLVDIVMPGEKGRSRLQGGYKAAWAYGYDGIISLRLQDEEKPSFLINTIGGNVDLSRDEQVVALAKKQKADLVRGALCIKAADQTPLVVSHEEIFQAVMPVGWKAADSKGKIRELLVGEGEWTEARLRSRFGTIKQKLHRIERLLQNGESDGFGVYVDLDKSIQELLPPGEVIKKDFKSVAGVYEELYQKYFGGITELEKKYGSTELGKLVTEYRKTQTAETPAVLDTPPVPAPPVPSPQHTPEETSIDENMFGKDKRISIPWGSTYPGRSIEVTLAEPMPGQPENIMLRAPAKTEGGEIDYLSKLEIRKLLGGENFTFADLVAARTKAQLPEAIGELESEDEREIRERVIEGVSEALRTKGHNTEAIEEFFNTRVGKELIVEQVKAGLDALKKGLTNA